MEVEVPPRVPFLWSPRQELSYERTHVDRVQYFLTRGSFRDIAPLLDVACGSVLDTPLVPPRPIGSPPFDRKSMSGAKSARDKPSESICGPDL
jgi:hypothetical protein